MDLRKSPTNVRLNFENAKMNTVNKMVTQSEPTSMTNLTPSLVRNAGFLYSLKSDRIDYLSWGIIRKCFQLAMTVLTGTINMTDP